MEKKTVNTLLSVLFFMALALLAFVIWKQCLLMGGSGALCRELLR